VQTLFAITPLNWVEWKAVLYLSAPVIIIDEVLKFISVRVVLIPSTLVADQYLLAGYFYQPSVEAQV
jgi:Ca2+ transporting ATPase